MFQSVMIIGNVGRELELKYTTGGEAVVNFSVACNETWKDSKGAKQERTTWFKVSAWGKDAENASQYLTKGSRVFVMGRVSAEAFLDKAGKPVAVLALRSTRIVYLSKAASGAAVGVGANGPAGESSEAESGDLPF